MRYKFFILLLLNFAKSQNITDVEELRKTLPGFFYTMPKILVSGRNETVCLSTHYSKSFPVKATVDLKLKEKHFLTTRSIDSEHSCFEIYVPENLKHGPHSIAVKVQVHMNGVIYSAHNQDPVVIYPKKDVTFIETDRLTYKSEDSVKIRILVLGENLLPFANYQIAFVRISNPVGVGVMVWENVTTDLGLVQLEYPLPPNSLTGKWKIEVNGETKIFEVNKYVLPRFKVYIVNPKVIYYNTSSVTVKVCAKYSYGGVVKGSAFIRLSDSHQYLRTIQDLKKMSNGCAEFIFSQTALSLDSIKKTFPMIEPRITVLITATVTEYGTDKIELTTSKSLILLRPYSMKFIKNDVFLPGLPYHGVLQLNNVNVDLNGEVIEICYNIAIKKSWNYLNNEHCSNFTLKNDRLIRFHILPLKSNVIHLQLNARSLNHSSMSDSLLVVRLYSPSSSYIVLEKIHSQEVLKCRSVQHFSVQYTTDKVREHENMIFYYMIAFVRISNPVGVGVMVWENVTTDLGLVQLEYPLPPNSLTIKARDRLYKMRKITHSVKKHYLNYSAEYSDIIGTTHKHLTQGSSIGKFTLKFRLDEKIVSNYQLLVYYITAEGELVSATKEVEVEPCFTNEVKASWSHKQIVPGGTASLLLETKSNSLCSVTATDKATRFMDEMTTLDIKSILKPFLQKRESPDSGRKSCVPPMKRNKEVLAEIQSENLGRKKRFIYSFSEDYDAYNIFNKFDIITITNFRIITKPCYTGPAPQGNINSVQYLTDQYDIQNHDRTNSIRTFFPQTWLWELVPVRNAAVIHRTIPHTITTWETNVLCVSATDGLGLSKTSEIVAFQPFFVDVLTPYSIKQGETMYLHTIVFNYLTYNIPIRITLLNSDGLILVGTTTRRSFSHCVSSNNSITRVYELKAVKVEKVNVTVVAELDPSYPVQCGPDILINKRDIVSKTILVEPEGYPVQITKSALLCKSDQHSLSNITWQIKTPNDLVFNTLKTEIILNGDILGQAIENLNDLIVMPTGCGEQIMATLAPNLHILKYLQQTKHLTSAIRHKVIRNLKIGYQRILNYVHKDGSFSAFGYYDPSGSMFLTAFVVRTLQEMKQYIYVDKKIIDRAVSWIFNHQLENGCFSTMLHVFQDMGGTTFENSTAGLTAYVMISLLDANIEVPESVQTNAKYCIRGYYHLDKYTLAISSYALLKINWYSEANRMLKKLFQISNQKDNMMWWTNKDTNGSLASDIEITSYVLLSLVHQKTQESLAKAHSIVQWLSTQYGPKGGFKSTQDTVVALDALTKYSNFVNSEQTNLTVLVNADHRDRRFDINHKDRLKSRKILLKTANNNVKIEVQGKGCILAQTVSSYFAKYGLNSETFKLDMEVLPVSKIDECSIATLSSCFSYNGPDRQSNMVVLEVDLPSGYEADRTTLYKLLDEKDKTKVKMFEELHQKIVFYLTKLDSESVCVNFNINEYIVVQSRSNSSIKLYDYYKPEYRVLQFYKMNDKCKTGSSIMPIIINNTTNDKEETMKNIDVRLIDGIDGNATINRNNSQHIQ